LLGSLKEQEKEICIIVADILQELEHKIYQDRGISRGSLIWVFLNVASFSEAFSLSETLTRDT